MKQHNTHQPNALEPLAQSMDVGASPSNTAPTNDIKILRNSIDSLYLSFQGNLSSHWDDRLLETKYLARSESSSDQVKAQITICDQLFEVKASGRGKFSYVLVDGWFQIQISSANATSLPLAYVQISSELLTMLGVNEAVNKLLPIINSLGEHQDAKVSRIDLCVDFTAPIKMDSWSHDAWITRAHHIDPHYVNGQFSGWSIGQGGNIVCRLYNKTLELKKSKKYYMLPIWKQCGWNEIDDVWRLEFQVRASFFTDPKQKELKNILSSLDLLWHYCATDWCRLSIINDKDSRRSRWPTHPLWEVLSNVKWNTSNMLPIKTPAKHRAPSDSFLFIHGLGGVTSFMAREGINDWSEGFGEFIAQAKMFHDREGKNSFDKYIFKKVKEKQRRFNTHNNNQANGIDYVTKQDEADAYRNNKDGE